MAVAQPMPSFTYALVRFSSSEDSRLHKPVETTVIRYCAWDSWPTQITLIRHCSPPPHTAFEPNKGNQGTKTGPAQDNMSAYRYAPA